MAWALTEPGKVLDLCVCGEQEHPNINKVLNGLADDVIIVGPGSLNFSVQLLLLIYKGSMI